jgi:aminoglycoside phosphotransferase (APT) family kinase protein
VRADGGATIAKLLGPVRRHFYVISESRSHRPHVLVIAPRCFGWPKLVAKLPDATRVGSDAPTNLHIEATLLLACERQALPAPVLLRADGGDGIIMTHIGGIPVNEFLDTSPESSTRRRHSVIHQLACLLATVHERLSSDPVLKNAGLPVRDSLNELRLLEVRIASLDPEYRKVTEPLFLSLSQSIPQHEELAITHGDCSVSNVLIAKGGALALIDWESAVWAPVELELSFVASWANGLCRNPGEIKYFLETYEHYSQRSLNAFNYYCALDMLKQATAAQSVGGDFSPFINVAQFHLELQR